ncbi:FG-GAP-like repeat-containing protein [Longispora albida]|uniref:FG-GAP-like repeat-containing protein n=1 Tax=Longispora albida TaxID=203523 RepID=UPI00146AFD0A|nr:FG-GAP-like repeat-containing protein [Longispora albida]
MAAVFATGLVPAAAQAQPAGATTLYVNDDPGLCSDQGGGSQGQPFCTIQKAADVAGPGQTVRIRPSVVEKNGLRFTKSGTAEAPIRFVVDSPDSTGYFTVNTVPDKPVSFEPGVHDVQVTGLYIGGGSAIKITQAQSIVIDDSILYSPVSVSGSGKVTIQRNDIGRTVTVDGKSTGVVVSTNKFRASGVKPVVVGDASGTTITSNTFVPHPDGVEIIGATDTRLTNNYFYHSSTTADLSKPYVTVDSASAPSTKISHTAFGTADKTGPLYRWAGVDYKTVAAFQAATGQGTADLTENWARNRSRNPFSLPAVVIDSADATAPGQLGTDMYGRQRLRFPSKPAADPSHHDRGAIERIPNVYATTLGAISMLDTPDGMTAEVTRIQYRAEWGGGKLTATYIWGDGTTTESSVDLPLLTDLEYQYGSLPAQRHRFTRPGGYQPKVELMIEGAPAPSDGLPSNAWVSAPMTTWGNSDYKKDGSQIKADFTGDGYDDVVLLESIPMSFQARLLKGGAAGFQETTDAWWGGSPWYGTIKSLTAGDFNGDGKAELGIFFERANGYVALYTLSYDASTGRFSEPTVKWEAPQWGTGTRYVASGDFNADGRADLALYYQYSGSHAAVFTLKGNSDGSLGSFKQEWNAPLWGTGTQSMTAGDFNGDGKAELALFYHYGGTHVAAFTLDGGALTTRWNAPYWGGGTKLVQAGNFGGDKKADLALFYDYGNGHVTAFSLLSGPSGVLSGLGTIWDGPVWGGGTRFLTSGNYTAKDERTELGMFYDYGNYTVTLMTLSPAQGGAYSGPYTRWTAQAPGVKTGA